MADPADRVWTAALAAVCGGAWMALLAADRGLAPFPLCGKDDVWMAWLHEIATPAGFANGASMLAAMMAPLTVSPLRHLRARSFARRRGRATLLFLVGYILVWGLAGAAIAVCLQGLRDLGGAAFAFGSLSAAAAAWQVSPAKQWMLNRCHSRRALAAFGAAADFDAWLFGVEQGGSCAGGCWALMAAPLALDRGMLPAMALVSGFLFAERLDRPAPLAWRLRPSAKILRLAAARASLFRERLPMAAAWLRAASSRAPRPIPVAKG